MSNLATYLVWTPCFGKAVTTGVDVFLGEGHREASYNPISGLFVIEAEGSRAVEGREARISQGRITLEQHGRVHPVSFSEADHVPGTGKYFEAYSQVERQYSKLAAKLGESAGTQTLRIRIDTLQQYTERFVVVSFASEGANESLLDKLCLLDCDVTFRGKEGDRLEHDDAYYCFENAMRVVLGSHARR